MQSPISAPVAGTIRRTVMELYLHEQMLLLALRDRKGTVDYRAGHYHLAMGGAILCELALAGCVRIDGGKRARVDAVRNANSPSDDVLAEAYRRVRDSRKVRWASTWVTTFGHMKRLRHRTALALCRRGVLRTAESQVLLVLSRKTYPTVDPRPEAELVAALREAVASDGDVDPRVGIVLLLSHATGSLKINVDRKQLRSRKARLKELAAGRRFADLGADSARAAHRAVKSAVESAVAAAVASQIAITTAAATATATATASS